MRKNLIKAHIIIPLGWYELIQDQALLKRNKQKKKDKEMKKNQTHQQKGMSKTSLGVRDFRIPHGIKIPATWQLKWTRGAQRKRLTETQTGKKQGRVTGFGSRGACCLSGRLWLGEGLCPLRCCLGTHHVRICQIFASERRYGRFL